ncbi:hypothetical protein GYH30_044930 [Glycine max]|nr:hypothetical protein GYH30_044930 [Glycine max]
MSCYFLKLFYALLLLLLHAAGSILGFNSLPNSAEIKCIESERQALLNFTHGLIDDSGILSTWRDHDTNRDCCKWKGIQCNNQTGHVEMLHLRGQDTQYLIGAINISSLIALENIEHLDLSYNEFEASHIPELMGSFTNLRYLNLSDCSFGGSIPSDLGKLTHLLSLDLSNNFLLHGQIPYQLGNLTHLQYLDLSDNHLDGELPYQLGNLSQLRYLDLRENSFSGALPFQVGNLPLLHTLGLGGNFDVKSKDAEWLTKLSSLTKLKLSSLHNLSSSHHLLQMISKLIPNLRELRLFDCSLSDTNIQSLFYSPSNFSTALNILDLSSNKLTSSTFQLLSNFSLNLQELYLGDNNIVLSSPLCPNFPSLLILDLSYNNLTSSVFQGGFNFSSKLQNLDLQNCSLTDGSFLMSSSFIMSSSSSLVSLDLSSNLLKSSTIFYWLINSTTNLHNLLLYNNTLEGPIPDGFGKLMNSLEVLHLTGNKLQGEIPSFFGNMCTLQGLHLSNNKLNGEISSFFQNSSWCNRHIFKRLYLSYNRLTGKLPKSIGLLSELEVLTLVGNSLEGDVTESHLSNFSKLKRLYLSENSLSLKLVPSWVPPFQLKYLRIRSCKLGPTFPSWLKTQSSLYELDISDNGINDSVPDWFWNNLQYMTDLNMSFNYLIGAIPDISLKLPNRPSIILNSNQFEGKIPSFLLQAPTLMLSENNFSDLFPFLCDQSTAANLATLDVSHNQIKGQLPDCWKSVKQLVFLDLSSNKLSGKIPMSMGALVNMEALVLRNNGLMGELPSSLKNCSSLIMLDLSENMLSGPIPSWIGESMHQLIILSMRGNHLSGNLPIHLCYLNRIQLLDLSRNNLSGGIPTCLKNLTAMSEQSINSSDTMSHIYSINMIYYEIYFVYTLRGYTLDITWMWKGVEREFKNPEFKLKSIDLSSNNLMGEIPKEVGYLLGLVSLNLSRNNLSGEIPSQIGNLSSLESLDLSRNHIFGRIPSSLSEIDDLGKLDLSHNSLSGRIPSGRHFETFEASSFEGNIDLCGEQLNKTCPGDEDQTKEEHQEGDDSVFYEGLYMSLGIGYFTGFWGLLGPLLLWRPWRIAYIRFLNRLTDYVYGPIIVAHRYASLIQNIHHFAQLQWSLVIKHTHFCDSSRFTLTYHDYSRYAYLFLMHEKSQSLDVFKTFKVKVENQLNKRIKCVRSNRGGKYYGKYDSSGEQRLGPFARYLEECGIVPRYTMPGSPNMNDVAERRNITLKDMRLDLSNNKLNGEISSFFQNSSWCNRDIFKILYLSFNRLIGMLPESIGLLSELEELSLAVNSLEGDVTKSHLCNFSKLKLLYLSENSLSLKLVLSWFPPFQLEILGLTSCKLGHTFPSWLKTQSSLYELDISDNRINDSVPDWFWNNLQYMRYLNMSYNYLIGVIPNISWKRVYEGSTAVHNIPLLHGQVKVDIEEIKDVDALVPVLTDEVILVAAYWQMVIILPKENPVWFCSLHNRPENYLKGIINCALKGLDDTPQPKSKAGAREKKESHEDSSNGGFNSFYVSLTFGNSIGAVIGETGEILGNRSRCCYRCWKTPRNVITHSLCVVVFGSCDDLELVFGGAENRWMTMKNLMLEDTGTQRSDRM